MTLIETLGIRPGVTALVGAGGKTSTMLRLARELRGAGQTVAVTTTTPIFPPPADLCGAPLYSPGERELAAAFGITSLPTPLFRPMDEIPQMAQGVLLKKEL